MEVRLLEAMLLDRPKGCEQTAFRVHVFSELHQPLSMAAVKSFQPEADALRQEIGVTFQDGSFASLIDRWFVFSNVEANSLVQLMEERRRNAYALVAVAVMSVFLVLLAWMYHRARAATRSANRANRVKDDFLANVSHEIRTPMNGVVGMAEMLLDTPLNAEQREYTATIAESARLQLVILNDVLDSAKIESGRMTLESVAFSPASLVKDVWRAFHPVAHKKDLHLELDVPGLLPSVMGDPVRIRQVLTNLVSNAVKFTPAGEVRIAVAAGAAYRDGAADFTFTVSDTGVGIDPAVQERIFDKSTQADCSTTRHFGGTGLGLSICRSLAELMGGSIHLESTPGRGSRFSFHVCLPTVQANLPGAASTLPIQTLTAAHPILVVEDNPINQKVVTAILRTLGLSYDIAADGLEGVTKCLSRPYSAVLMDCQMPGMDGFEASRRIRASQTAAVPIIALTATAAPADRTRAAAAGMDDFLSKPIHRRELAETLSRWLHQVQTTPQKQNTPDPTLFPTALRAAPLRLRTARPSPPSGP